MSTARGGVVVRELRTTTHPVDLPVREESIIYIVPVSFLPSLPGTDRTYYIAAVSVRPKRTKDKRDKLSFLSLSLGLSGSGAFSR